MKKLFSGLFLFLISGLAFADPAWNNAGLPTPVASHTDLSVAYLAQVFGTVGNSLQGTSGQMLGMLFSKLNEGIMVVAGLWLIYTVLTIILRSAMDGSFMGPNKNVFWIVIRIALAFAMLIPGPMTGYNVIQDIVMKVVVEGVSLADQTWNFGLQYIKAGGTIWRSPSTTGGGTAVVSWSQGQKILAPAKSIFDSEVCMVASSVINDTSSNGSTGNGVVNSGSSSVDYNVVETSNSFAFPGLKNTSNYRTTIADNPAAANCGYISWNTIPGYNQNGQTSQMMAKAAMSQLVYDLYPAAKKYVCANYPGAGGASVCSGVNTDSISSDNGESVFNAMVNYVNAVYPLAQAKMSSAHTSAKNFISDAMNEGWLMAGRYYWDLSQIQAHLKQVSDIGNYKPGSVTAGSNPAIGYNSNLKNFVDGTSATWDSYKNSAKTDLTNYSKASNAGDAGSDSSSLKKSIGNKVLDVLLGGLISDIVSLFALFSTHGGAMGMGPNPIVFLHQVGMQCIQIAGYIWVDLAVALFGLSAATMVCQSTLNLDTPLSAITGWIKPPLMILAAALLGVGVLLGYYVPLYPFMLFTFGIIGWIISVIEAMVAGPLIAFGLTHPEGHDFLGEAKQGLMLLLGVFLRPVLMVIGLIAGMILSYVALRILVYTYSGFLQDVFYVSSPSPGASGSVLEGATMATLNVMGGGGIDTGSIVMSLFTFPLMLGVFASLVYVVTNQCFSLIYVLPDYILRWIGGPAQSSAVSASDMARQVQGQMSQMADTGSKATNEGMTAKMRENQSDNKEGNAPSKKKVTDRYSVKK